MLQPWKLKKEKRKKEEKLKNEIYEINLQKLKRGSERFLGTISLNSELL